MPRWRLGVALLIPEPVLSEINGLRRALGDGALERMPPHLTLVPPVNVRIEALPEAYASVRRAASLVEPFALRFGPVSTFFPLTPVIKLDVSDETGDLIRLRNEVFRPPLERPLTWPFVPHVTLADDAPRQRIEAALAALHSYEAEMKCQYITILREGEGRRWEAIADVALGPPSRKQGSLPLELVHGTLLDPEAAETLGVAAAERFDLVVTALREDKPVAVAAGQRQGSSMLLQTFAVSGAVRGQGIGPHLVAEFLSLSAQSGVTECISKITCPDIGAFLERHGFHHGVRRV